MDEADGKIHVVVDNVHEIGVASTEEREPEFFVFTTFTLIPGQSGYQQILALDPLRKDASVYPVDNPIVLCHSASQAMSAANQAAGFTDPDGAYVPQGVAVSLSGTGPAWAACQTATRVSVVINRREKLG